MTSDEKLFAAIAFDCGYDQGYDDGKDNERKRIVAWLRQNQYRQIADWIEREAHHE
jgi:hypothetical protein